MTEKQLLIKLLQDTVDCLSFVGYVEVGGSEVFRIMNNKKDKTTIKIFLNDYEEPTHIIMRFSSVSVEREE